MKPRYLHSCALRDCNTLFFLPFKAEEGQKVCCSHHTFFSPRHASEAGYNDGYHIGRQSHLYRCAPKVHKYYFEAYHEARKKKSEARKAAKIIRTPIRQRTPEQEQSAWEKTIKSLLAPAGGSS